MQMEWKFEISPRIFIYLVQYELMENNEKRNYFKRSIETLQYVYIGYGHR